VPVGEEVHAVVEQQLAARLHAPGGDDGNVLVVVIGGGVLALIYLFI